MYRLILLETASQLKTSLSTFPGTASRIPPFFDRQPDVDTEVLKGFYLEPTMAAAMQSFTGYGFPVMAKAIAILDRVIGIVQSSNSTQVKLRELQTGDTELQVFLTEAMKGYRRPGHHCGAIAVGIRQVEHYHLRTPATTLPSVKT